MIRRYIVRKGEKVIANVADPVQACNICRHYTGSYVISTETGQEIYHNMGEEEHDNVRLGTDRV